MKLSGFLILFLMFSASAAFSQKTHVTGTLSGSTSSTSITLENFLQPTLFSQKANIEKGKFTFEFDLDREDIFKLKLSDKNYLGMVIKPGDKIKLTLGASQLNLLPVIEGSDQTILLYDTEKKLQVIAAKQDSLNKAYSTADATQKKEIETAYYALDDEKNNLIANTIKLHPDYLVNMFFIERLNIDQYYDVYKLLDSTLSQKYSYNSVVANLHQSVTSAKATAVGAKAPEINLPTPSGELLNLYSIKGKIIIVDFWASWCRPCRAENPNMTQLYADYHSKGLEIFGVSLDKDSASWVKAISDDKLIWHHVSDLKFWSSVAAKAYGVGSIPSMFVLDSEYNIIAKNIRGEQLRNFVAGKLN